MCGYCNGKNLAIRYCMNCPEKLYCLTCFKQYHARGNRKRHDKKRIVYEGQASDANMSVISKKEGEQQSAMEGSILSDPAQA